ncbi:hypothetical protein FRX31_004502 [Thalictrum thalictroides]|uniref:Uncharacterized protein n=1 Tax=Thalictrum thalictroides TaxID=46969 RepID=A0A7J6XBS7_THATH|nr:hypothetical protein FRX31_004502 [Thalictrum thalictroides]
MSLDDVHQTYYLRFSDEKVGVKYWHFVRRADVETDSRNLDEVLGTPIDTILGDTKNWAALADLTQAKDNGDEIITEADFLGEHILPVCCPKNVPKLEATKGKSLADIIPLPPLSKFCS